MFVNIIITVFCFNMQNTGYVFSLLESITTKTKIVTKRKI